MLILHDHDPSEWPVLFIYYTCFNHLETIFYDKQAQALTSWKEKYLASGPQQKSIVAVKK